MSEGREQRLDAAPAPPCAGVAELLDRVELRTAQAVVRAGHCALDAPVRVVLASDRLRDLEMLRGGELVVMSLRGLGAEPAAVARTLAGRGAAGLVLPLDPATAVPPELTAACDAVRLALITVAAELSVAALADAVQTLTAERRLAALLMSEEAHETFTRMCVEGAPPQDIVTELARLCGCPAVFENLVHQVLAYAAGDMPAAELLDGWESLSRGAAAADELVGYGPAGWLSAWVEVRGRTWGRLVLLLAGPVTVSQRIALKRAAAALALNRLIEQNKSSLDRQAHRSTLADIIGRRYRSTAEMQAHTAALGVPTKGRVMVAVIVDVLELSRPVDGARGSAADTVASSLSSAGIQALVADLRRGRIGVLLPMVATDDRRLTLTRFVRDLKQRGPAWADPGLIVAVGSTVQDLDQVARSFTEAHQVADAARGANTEKLYYELPDIQLRGLLHMLGDDPRLQSFVERTLGMLLEFDQRNQTDLVDSLRTFLLHGGNKSAAAEAAHVARQTFYRRLATVQRILSMDLESAEVRTSLHAAIMALESQRSTQRQRAAGFPADPGDPGGRSWPANAEPAW